MWIWIIIIAVVIGAILGYLGSDGKDSGSNAAQGAMAGGCMAGGCIMQIAIAALSIFLLIWLFGLLFG